MKRDGVAPMRKAKIPIPAARLSASSSRAATGYYGIFAEILRISAPRFRKKKDLNP